MYLFFSEYFPKEPVSLLHFWLEVLYTLSTKVLYSLKETGCSYGLICTATLLLAKLLKLKIAYPGWFLNGLFAYLSCNLSVVNVAKFKTLPYKVFCTMLCAFLRDFCSNCMICTQFSFCSCVDCDLCRVCTE